MAQLMGDPLDPNAHDDGAPTSAGDAPALVPETARADTSVAIDADARRRERHRDIPIQVAYLGAVQCDDDQWTRLQFSRCKLELEACR